VLLALVAAALARLRAGLQNGAGDVGYVEAVAGEVDAADRADAPAVYSGRLLARGIETWGETDVTGPAAHRLYRARASRVYLLGDGNRGVPVT